MYAIRFLMFMFSLALAHFHQFIECGGKLVAHAQGTLYVRDPK
jgi:hypothetical protein